MIDSLVIERLQAIGLTPHTLQQLQARPEPPAACSSSDGDVPMRVTEVQRDSLTLHDGAREHAARLLPALRHALAASADAVAVGDWVLAAPDPHGEWWVHDRLHPRNQLARRLHDGRDKTTRVVIAANVDTALLVMGLDGDFSLRRLERYLALVHMAGVRPVVVLTKADLCADAADVAARMSAVRPLLPPGAAVVALDALGPEPAERLSPWLGLGQTLVLLGSSGTGKSTLTNALTRTTGQATGANRHGDGRGRHTTTARSLHRTVHGACIVDTPGLRTLRLDGEADALKSAFDDIAALAAACRYRDCRHAGEPGCAVRGAVPDARISGFHKLLREARRDSLSALERKAQVGQWKSRGREARLRTEAKRGGETGG